jgi:hypothetical protein
MAAERAVLQELRLAPAPSAGWAKRSRECSRADYLAPAKPHRAQLPPAFQPLLAVWVHRSLAAGALPVPAPRLKAWEWIHSPATALDLERGSPRGAARLPPGQARNRDGPLCTPAQSTTHRSAPGRRGFPIACPSPASARRRAWAAQIPRPRRRNIPSCPLANHQLSASPGPCLRSQMSHCGSEELQG